jgi:zinc protease
MTPFSLLALAVASSSLGRAPAVSIPFEKYTLEGNGLEVILSKDPSLPVVAVNLWYHAGPINESPKRTGFAHLFEHLMFQGSAHVGDDKHFELLDSSGASQINGTTDFDRTNYFETVPKNQLALALWLESDRMGFLRQALTQEKLDNQREVVMNERRQSVDNRPYGPSEEKLVQLLFPPEHPYYGNVIGSMDDLTAANIDDVKAFYDRYYAPANATLAIVGDIDVAETKRLVDKYFGTLPRRPAPPPMPVKTPPVTRERRAVVKEPVQLPRVAMGWLSPPAYAPGDADADVLAFILGAGKSSRMYQRLVYELELAQNIDVSQESQALASMFVVSITGRPGADVKKLEAETQKVLDGIKKDPPTAREVERAKNMLLTSIVGGLQNVGGFGGKADTLNRYNQYVGDPGHLPRDIGRYDTVTPETVQALAQKLLDNNSRVVVITEAQ